MRRFCPDMPSASGDNWRARNPMHNNNRSQAERHAGRQQRDISSVVARDLCHGCGVCVSTCNSNAIVMRASATRGLLLAAIDYNSCVACGTCIAVCPGHDVQFAPLAGCTTSSTGTRAGIGGVLEYHIGHALDINVRRDSASGGFVTGLLIAAMNSGEVDGVLTARMSRKDPLRSEVFIAQSIKDIVSASGSIYCPVALGTGLKEVEEFSGRVAVVGLPCQIHGIRKAQAISPGLRHKIALVVGIYCGHTDSHHATTQALREHADDLDSISSLAYRGRGWPGSLRAETAEGREIVIPYREFISRHERYFFAPLRCMTCVDASNRLADISVMDAWLPELESRGEDGYSMVLARTAIGVAACSRAERLGSIARWPSHEEDVWRSHGAHRLGGFDFLPHRAWALATGRGAPVYDLVFPRPSILNWIRVSAMWFNAMSTATERRANVFGNAANTFRVIRHFLRRGSLTR